jgi:hypothetical protein
MSTLRKKIISLFWVAGSKSSRLYSCKILSLSSKYLWKARRKNISKASFLFLLGRSDNRASISVSGKCAMRDFSCLLGALGFSGGKV